MEKDEPRWRREARERQREYAPGELVATATPDGEVQPSEPLVASLWSRDIAAYALAKGCTLLGIEQGLRGPTFLFDNQKGDALTALRLWNAGSPLINARRMAEAGAVLRRLLRTDAATIEPTRLAIREEKNTDEQGRSA